MYSNSNSSQGNFGSYSSNPQFAPNQYAQNFQQQQQQQQIPQQQQQQQQQAPPSAGGGGGYVNAPMMQQQQQRPYSQYAAYGQYPNAPFRGNVSNNYNGGNRNDPNRKWDQPFMKDFLEAPRSWTKIDKQVDNMFSDTGHWRPGYP